MLQLTTHVPRSSNIKSGSRRPQWWPTFTVPLCAVLVAVVLMAATLGSGLSPMTPTVVEASSGSPVYPLKVSSNGRYLVDQTNQAVLINGDAPWSLIVEGTNGDMDTYFANRQAKGVNAVLVNLIDHKFGDRAPANIKGDAPFSGAAFVSPNEAYFAHADYAVTSAAKAGMVVLLDALYLGYNCGDEGWCAQVEAATSGDLQSWGEYVGNRYKNNANIVWVVGGDVDPSGYAGVSAKVTAFVAGLTQADSGHVITAHNSRGEMAVTPWGGATWLSLNNVYATYGAATYQMGQTAYNVSPAKPFIEIEGWYENEHGMTTQQLRAQAYWTVLSGGAGYMFGNCPLWGLGAPAATFCTGTSSDWKAQLDGAGSKSMGHVKEVFAGRGWQNLVPDGSHTLVTGGYGTNGGTDYATAERSGDGTLAMVYLPTVRTVSVDMSQMSGGVTASWFDPTSGGYTVVAGSPLANVGTRQFTPTGNNSAGDGDWVLVLETLGG